MTKDDRFQTLVERRNSRKVALVSQIIETEWNRVSRELDALDIDSGDTAKAAILVGQFQILDKLMAALSEGSLASDYEIEAQWRIKLIERVVDAFNLDLDTRTPPRQYKSLAQQIADACGLEVIQD
jgi:hypothetical protein